QALQGPRLLVAQKLKLRSRLLELGLRLGAARGLSLEVGLELTLTLLTLAPLGLQPPRFELRLLELARPGFGLQEMCLFLLLEPRDPRFRLAERLTRTV